MKINYLSFNRHCAAVHKDFLYLLHEKDDCMGISKIRLNKLYDYYQYSINFEHDLEKIMNSDGELIGLLPLSFNLSRFVNCFQITACNNGIYIFPLTPEYSDYCGFLSFKNGFSKINLPYEFGFSRCGTSENGETVYFLRMWAEQKTSLLPFVETVYVPQAEILVFNNGKLLTSQLHSLYNEKFLCVCPKRENDLGIHNTYYFQNGKLKNKNIALAINALWYDENLKETNNPHYYLSCLATFANTLVDDQNNMVCEYLNQFFESGSVYTVRDTYSGLLSSTYPPEQSESCSLRFKVLAENEPYHNDGLRLEFGLVWDNQGQLRICDCAADDIENLNDDWYVFHWKEKNITALRYRPFMIGLENSFYRYLLKDSELFATAEETVSMLPSTQLMLKEFMKGK